ncbi:MAG TPA: hypothetical protein VEL28_19230 [Candidatus Binatia bacterium]|nr:hypothetical protein [Candidatus Binatia bacterium]
MNLVENNETVAGTASSAGNRPNIVYLRSYLNSWLVLSVGSSNNFVVTAWLDPTDKREQWYREDHDSNFQLINAATGEALSCLGGQGHGSRLIASGNGDSWNAAGGTPLQAVRAAGNLDLNVTINAASQDIGAPVILWDWSNGAHQRWAITNQLDVPILPTAIVRIDGGRGTATVLADDGQQISVKDIHASPVPSEQILFRKIGYGDSFALQNMTTGKYLAYQGVAKSVLRGDAVSTSALWTSVDTADPRAKYVRPLLNGNAI